MGDGTAPPEKIPVSLVLGSGGARGLAHIGVIQALQEHGRFDIRTITGSSMGALIGGLHAAGKLDLYTDWVRGLSRGDIWGLLDFSFTSVGLFKGDRLMDKLAELVGRAQIEDLPIPFTAVASDIDRRQEVWIHEGPLFEAIRASIAIPGFFTPVRREGRLLVDGGLMSPLPMAPAQQHATERLIAVSLNGHDNLRRPVSSSTPPPALRAEGDADTTSPRSGSGLSGWYADMRAKLRWGSGPTEDSGHRSAVDIVTESLEAMQDRIARYQIAAYGPDVLIQIPVDACRVLDFDQADKMIALGYEKTMDALAQEADAD